MIALLASEALEVVNVALGPHDHLESRDHLVACWTVSCSAEEPVNNGKLKYNYDKFSRLMPRGKLYCMYSSSSPVWLGVKFRNTFEVLWRWGHLWNPLHSSNTIRNISRSNLKITGTSFNVMEQTKFLLFPLHIPLNFPTSQHLNPPNSLIKIYIWMIRCWEFNKREYIQVVEDHVHEQHGYQHRLISTDFFFLSRWTYMRQSSSNTKVKSISTARTPRDSCSPMIQFDIIAGIITMTWWIIAHLLYCTILDLSITFVMRTGHPAACT